jgi:hypothetical protein
MSEDNPSGDSPHTIQPKAADEVRVNADDSQVELWMAGHYARAWFTNAKKQAMVDDDHDDMAKPREIVFAVCAIESYLVEWVRDEVLKLVNSDYKRLDEYFTIEESYDPILERWKKVIKRLLEKGAIPAQPDFTQHYWKEFSDLVKFRNGLMHGRASWPDSNSIPDKRKRAGPTNEELVKMDQGWAVGVVAEVIRQLHAAVGTPAPAWLDA